MLNLYEVTVVTNKRAFIGKQTGESSKEAREDAKHYWRYFDKTNEEEYIIGTITRLINEDI